MQDDLRIDLVAIVLGEAFGLLDDRALKLASGKIRPSVLLPHEEHLLASAIQTVYRIESRCGKIEG